jgi:hypothetical protein
VAENSPKNGKRFLFCANMTGTEKRKQKEEKKMFTLLSYVCLCNYLSFLINNDDVRLERTIGYNEQILKSLECSL